MLRALFGYVREEDNNSPLKVELYDANRAVGKLDQVYGSWWTDNFHYTNEDELERHVFSRQN